MSHRDRTPWTICIPDAKFGSGTFSIFGDIMHKLALSKRGAQVIEFVYLPSGDGFKSLQK